jgi:hypothetical protein
MLFAVNLGMWYTPDSFWCSPVLHLKSTVPRPSIPTDDLLPKRTDPRTPSSISANTDRAPVMWLVAPESRIHLVVAPSPLSPNWTKRWLLSRWIAAAGVERVGEEEE